MTLSEKLILDLNRLGLNPEYVEKIANESILEDLGGGADVTSLATIPEKQKSTAEFVSDRKSTRLNSSHIPLSRMPSSA